MSVYFAKNRQIGQTRGHDKNFNSILILVSKINKNTCTFKTMWHTVHMALVRWNPKNGQTV